MKPWTVILPNNSTSVSREGRDIAAGADRSHSRHCLWFHQECRGKFQKRPRSGSLLGSAENTRLVTKMKLLSSAKTSTSNLKKHTKERHKIHRLVYIYWNPMYYITTIAMPFVLSNWPHFKVCDPTVEAFQRQKKRKKKINLCHLNPNCQKSYSVALTSEFNRNSKTHRGSFLLVKRPYFSVLWCRPVVSIEFNINNWLSFCNKAAVLFCNCWRVFTS